MTLTTKSTLLKLNETNGGHPFTAVVLTKGKQTFLDLTNGGHITFARGLGFDGNVNVSGTWKAFTNGFVNVNGTWKELDELNTNVNGSYKN